MAEKSKIFHATMYYDTLGGIHTFIETLNDSLLKAKIESKILPINFRSHATAFRIPILGIYPYLFVMSFLKASEFSMRNKEQCIIHAHDTLFGGFTGVLIKFLLRKPLVLTTHGLQSIVDIYNYRRRYGNTLFSRLNRVFLLLLEKFVVTYADMILCTSEYEYDYFLLRGADVKKIKVVRNGIDTKKFTPKSTVFSRSETVILYTGRLTLDKGVDSLVKVFSLLTRSHQNLKLLIRGKGADRATIEKVIKELKVSRKVVLSTPVKRDVLVDAYNDADIVAIPSTIETGTPLSLLEAMACQRVVIVNKVGSLPYIVGSAGLVVRFNDPIKVSLSIKEILADREKAIMLAKRARERVARDFNWQNCFEEILSVYKVMHNRNTRA